MWAGDIISAEAPSGPAQLQEPGWGSQIPVGGGPGDFSKVGQVGERSDGGPLQLPPEGPIQRRTAGH